MGQAEETPVSFIIIIIALVLAIFFVISLLFPGIFKWADYLPDFAKNIFHISTSSGGGTVSLRGSCEECGTWCSRSECHGLGSCVYFYEPTWGYSSKCAVCDNTKGCGQYPDEEECKLNPCQVSGGCKVQQVGKIFQCVSAEQQKPDEKCPVVIGYVGEHRGHSSLVGEGINRVIYLLENGNPKPTIYLVSIKNNGQIEYYYGEDNWKGWVPFYSKEGSSSVGSISGGKLNIFTSCFFYGSYCYRKSFAENADKIVYNGNYVGTSQNVADLYKLYKTFLHPDQIGNLANDKIALTICSTKEIEELKSKEKPYGFTLLSSGKKDKNGNELMPQGKWVFISTPNQIFNSGILISNSGKILTYPEAHKLNIVEEDDLFKVAPIEESRLLVFAYEIGSIVQDKIVINQNVLNKPREFALQEVDGSLGIVKNLNGAYVKSDGLIVRGGG